MVSDNTLRRRLVTTLWLWLGLVIVLPVLAEDPVDNENPAQKTVEQLRLETMRNHVSQIVIRSRESSFPQRLENQPLFRYDDLTRGYVDGTVWRLGATGRPKAIITAELHPKYSDEPRIVYDYLSLSEIPFAAKLVGGVTWSSPGSAVLFQPFPEGPVLAETKPLRQVQLRQMAERFTAQQDVEGQKLELRLLPRSIDRYQPIERDNDDADAAMFLFVSGRNPGILLVIEVTGNDWTYGVGRLSAPSELTLRLNNEIVWHVRPAALDWNAPYNAANFPIEIPMVPVE